MTNTLTTILRTLDFFFFFNFEKEDLHLACPHWILEIHCFSGSQPESIMSQFSSRTDLDFMNLWTFDITLERLGIWGWLRWKESMFHMLKNEEQEQR